MKQKFLLLGISFFMFLFGAVAQTTHINGLVVVVKYKDDKINASETQISNMLNQESGFNLWNNETSVRQFYKKQSNNHISLNSNVVEVTLDQNSAYYLGNNLPYDGGQLLAKDAIAAVNAKYPNGFSGLTMHPTENRLWHFGIISYSPSSNGAGVAYGFSETQYVKNNGVNIPIRNVGLVSYTNNNYDVNVLCHEYGHSVFGWTDYYRTGWSNLGNYCVMGSAGNEKGPQPVSAPLRVQQNWVDNIIEIGNSPYTTSYTVVSNNYNTVHKYTNPYNPKEYLIIYPQVYGDYQQYLNSSAVADQGLAIYYVDEDGGMDISGLETSPVVKLIQADKKDELHDEDLRFTANHNDIRGDFDDLYDNINNSFPNGHPFRWKDGGELGISIINISAPGATMSFDVVGNLNKIYARSDVNGKISPSGVINSTSQTFTFIPNPGYEVEYVFVNSQSVSVSNNQYTMNGQGIRNINVTYKRKTSQATLPSSWQTADIGSANTPGFASHNNGKFLLETTGTDVWGTQDNLRYVYRELTGDGSLEVQLVASNRINHWNKSGIMIRESLDANSAHSFLFYSPSFFCRVQQRSTTGGISVDDPDNLADKHFYAYYRWQKIVREGNIISSYISKDKSIWVLVAQETIPMQNKVLIGMAVSNGYSAQANISLFENVTFTQVIPTNTEPLTLSTPCGNNNQTIEIELNTSKEINATGYNWYFTGSAQNIITKPGDASIARLNTGNYFSSGQACVGINYSSAPWYASYCITVPKCSNGREGSYTSEEDSQKIDSYPNPFHDQTDITFYGNTADITVYDSFGTIILETEAKDEYQFGANVDKGIYLLKITSKNKSETIRVIKE